jgi:Flp pilus assembly protein TadB
LDIDKPGKTWRILFCGKEGSGVYREAEYTAKENKQAGTRLAIDKRLYAEADTQLKNQLKEHVCCSTALTSSTLLICHADILLISFFLFVFVIVVVIVVVTNIIIIIAIVLVFFFCFSISWIVFSTTTPIPLGNATP